MRILEAHNGISGLIVENTRVTVDNIIKEFDGIWISNQTVCLSKGKVDFEHVDFSSRIETTNQILKASTKPTIFEGDRGVHPEQFVHIVKTLERMGVTAVIIDDQIVLKKNSLMKSGFKKTQDSIESFSL